MKVGIADIDRTQRNYYEIPLDVAIEAKTSPTGANSPDNPQQKSGSLSPSDSTSNDENAAVAAGP